MTDEVIKGLECCSLLPCSDCGNCPYEETDCKQGLLEDSLSCINRFKDERENEINRQERFAQENGFTPDCSPYYIAVEYKKRFQKSETQLREFLSALYQRTGKAFPFVLERKDIVELAKDYGYKEEELK